jgi:hypothetical protein
MKHTLVSERSSRAAKAALIGAIVTTTLRSSNAGKEALQRLLRPSGRGELIVAKL